MENIAKWRLNPLKMRAYKGEITGNSAIRVVFLQRCLDVNKRAQKAKLKLWQLTLRGFSKALKTRDFDG